MNAVITSILFGCMFLFLSIRLIFLYVKGTTEKDPEIMNQALFAMIFWILFLLSENYFYGDSSFLKFEKQLLLSSSNDVQALCMCLIPGILSVIDIIRFRLSIYK